MLSLDRLRKSGDGHVPALTEDGEIDRFALGLMDGASPLGEIARRLAERFPGSFRTHGEALNRAARLSTRYSR